MGILEKLRTMRRLHLVIFVAFVALVFGLIVGYLLTATGFAKMLQLPFASTQLFEKPTTGIPISTENISKKVEEYLTKNFLSEYNASAKVTNVTRLGNILYLDVDVIMKGEVVSSGNVYATDDGEFIILGNVYNMSTPLIQSTPKTTAQPSVEIQKSEKPNVTLFVMSFCPYGQQAETAMWPVLDLLGDKINFELHYVVYPAQYYAGQENNYCINKTYCSMHGVAELNEDVRQMCIMNSYNYSVWSDYIKTVSTSCNYQNVDSCWENVAKSKGIDTEAVKKCFDENAMKYAEQEYKLNQEYDVQGSPTLFINDVEYGGSRTPEAYKQTICSSFNQAPSSCSTQLGSTSGTVSGSCG